MPGLTYQRPESGALAQPLTSRLTAEYFVTDFGADRTGVRDSTIAFQTAVNQCSGGAGGRCRIRVPAGDYLISSHITVNHDRVIIQGEGKQISIIRFAPTRPDYVFVFHKSGSAIVQSGLIGIGFSGNNQQKKTGVQVITCSECVWRDIAFYPWTGHTLASGLVNVTGSRVTWLAGARFEMSMKYVTISGITYLIGSVDNDTTITLATSTRLSQNSVPYTSCTSGSRPFELHGHEAGSFSDIESHADDGWLIGKDPATETISLDHHNFRNIYTVTDPDSACWTVETGTYLTQDSWDGFQPQIQCQYGVFWNDLTSAGISNGLTFANWRWEQGNPLIGTVNTTGTLVTLVSAARFVNGKTDTFHPESPPKTIFINGTLYFVAAVFDSTHLYITRSAGDQTNIAFNTTGYAFYMSHNTGLQDVSIRNADGGYTAHGATDCNGMYFRNVQWLSIENVIYAGGSESVGLDIASSTNRLIQLSNLAFPSGAQVNKEGAQAIEGCYMQIGNLTCYTPSGSLPGGTYTELHNQANGFNQYESPPITLPVNSTLTLGTNAMMGFLMLSEYTSGVVCLVTIDGRRERTAITADAYEGCSTSPDTRNKVSVYWNSRTGRYELQNNLSRPATFYISLHGKGDHP